MMDSFFRLRRGFCRRLFFPRLHVWQSQTWPRRAFALQGFCGSKKGFTLFTALLAVVLISLTWLLMSSMTNSESGTSSTIDDIKQHDEMQSIIDLQRADAMQVFNFNLRVDTEEHLTELDADDLPTANAFPINRNTMNGDAWANIKLELSEYFASQDVRFFAARAANHLSNIIVRSTDVGGYAIDLANYTIDCSTGTCEMVPSDVPEFMNVVERMIQSQAAGGIDLMEPIQCGDGEFDDCLGTFYINMNLGLLSDAEYQSLPKIKIVHRRSGRSLVEPILPKGVFRIYMPTRYFKALAGGKAVAEALLGDDSTDEINSLQNETPDWAERTVSCSEPDRLLRLAAEQKIKDRVAAIANEIDSPGDFEIVKGSGGSWLAKIVVNPKHIFDTGHPTLEKCKAIVGDFDAYLVYEEKNPNYMVSQGIVRYGIRINGTY